MAGLSFVGESDRVVASTRRESSAALSVPTSMCPELERGSGTSRRAERERESAFLKSLSEEPTSIARTRSPPGPAESREREEERD